METPKKKKKSFNASAYSGAYSGPAAPMAGPPRLEIGYGLAGRMELKQKLVMTPPMAGSYGEAEAHSREVSRRFLSNNHELEDNMLRELSELVRSEDPRRPYDDKQITAYLKSIGYPVAQSDVARARNKLGLASSIERKVQFFE